MRLTVRHSIGGLQALPTKVECKRGEHSQKLTGHNLEVDLSKFSTLS